MEGIQPLTDIPLCSSKTSFACLTARISAMEQMLCEDTLQLTQGRAPCGRAGGRGTGSLAAAAPLSDGPSCSLKYS
jgi:hypothetical protein